MTTSPVVSRQTTQIPLIQPTRLPPRPTRDEYAEEAVQDLLVNITKYLARRPTQQEVEDLRRMFTWSNIVDNYYMTKDLERAGWVIDSDLIEILSSYDEYDTMKHANIRWRKQFASLIDPFRPTLKQPIFFVSRQTPRGLWSAPYVVRGVVIRVNENTAHATINSVQLGHIRQGEGSGTLGIILGWETLHSSAEITQNVIDTDRSVTCDPTIR